MLAYKYQRKQSFIGKISASVILKLFVNGYEIFYTTGTPAA